MEAESEEMLKEWTDSWDDLVSSRSFRFVPRRGGAGDRAGAVIWNSGMRT
jgi:hypothetical protein